MRKIIFVMVFIILSACGNLVNLGVSPQNGMCPPGYKIQGYTLSKTNDKVFADNQNMSNQKVMTKCFLTTEDATLSGYRDVTLRKPNGIGF